MRRKHKAGLTLNQLATTRGDEDKHPIQFRYDYGLLFVDPVTADGLLKEIGEARVERNALISLLDEMVADTRSEADLADEEAYFFSEFRRSSPINDLDWRTFFRATLSTTADQLRAEEVSPSDVLVYGDTMHSVVNYVGNLYCPRLWHLSPRFYLSTHLHRSIAGCMSGEYWHMFRRGDLTGTWVSYEGSDDSTYGWWIRLEPDVMREISDCLNASDPAPGSDGIQPPHADEYYAREREFLRTMLGRAISGELIAFVDKI